MLLCSWVTFLLGTIVPVNLYYKNIDGLINEKSELDSTSSVYKMEGFLQKNRPQNLTILRLGGLIGPKRHPVHFLAKKSTR